LSMDPNSLNAVKQVVRNTKMERAKEMVQQVLAAASADEIEGLFA
jgi:phosphoenolpyruvate-protein kinase (PTS system EI component)